MMGAVQPGAAGGRLGRLHPLVKLGWLVAVTVAVFVHAEPLYVGGLLLAILAAARWAGGGLLGALRGRRLLVWSGLTLFLLQALFYRGGTVLVDLLPGGGRIPITLEGLARGAVVAGRFLVVVVASQAFVLATDPGDLAYALMQAGLPYRYGFALVTALRMAPIFQAEATTVYQAQLTRGVRYDVGGPRRVLEILRQFLLPLLVSALRKVDALAISMEGRHFGRYPTRTFLRPLRAGPADAWAAGGLALFVLLTIWLRLTG